MEYKGLNYLRDKLQRKRTRVNLRYRYYEMKNIAKDLGISTPKELSYLNTSLGWCAKAVDSLADRLSFREFENDIFLMNDIFAMNNSDILIDSAIISALISSCSFIYISKDENGFPRLQAIDGGDATGIIDNNTNMMTEGYAVLSRDEYGEPIQEAYFTIGRTDYFENGKYVESFTNNAPYCLLVPIIYKSGNTRRRFGTSRITRACMDIMDGAMRTVKRGEITAEFYSYPQKYVTGLSDDAEFDKWKATISTMMAFYKDEDGDAPKVGQFTQQSMQPHVDHLRMYASLMASETGLTIDDFGFTSSNPTSAESIKASHENLRLTARKCQKVFGTCLLNVGYLSACVRDNMSYSRSVLTIVKPKFEPIFEPDASALSVIGDGAIKINQAVPEYFTKENLRDLTGIDYHEETNILEDEE